MKLTLAFLGVGWSHAAPDLGCSPHWSPVEDSAPAGGWKTRMSPTSGLPKCMPTRFTSTRWPIWSVGTIDSLGMRYGLTRKAWIASARPSATATMRTSSRIELPVDLAASACRAGSRLIVCCGRLTVRVGRGGLRLGLVRRRLRLSLRRGDILRRGRLGLDDGRSGASPSTASGSASAAGSSSWSRPGSTTSSGPT